MSGEGTQVLPKRILVVDDDTNFLKLVAMRLELSGFEASCATDGATALRLAREGSFHAAIVDLRLGDEDGIAVMARLHEINPYLPVIILTAHGSIESAVEAMKRGAYNFLGKPFDPEELLLQLGKAMEEGCLASQTGKLEGPLKEKHGFPNIVARSAKMREVLDLVTRVAKTDSTVCISGESGTGKEVIAKAIHRAGERSRKPFVAINCAAIPETLMESELFGYEKGAFTDARRRYEGLFSRAHTGTLFLDEIGDMALPLQAKLLRVLQEKRFYPLGSERPVDVDVRFIAATNKDLESEIRSGSFREDLFYRIHVVPIALPPLRERKEDIPALAEHFLAETGRRLRREMKGISVAAMERLMLHDWPGNVRELENTIERAVALTRSEYVEADLLPARCLSAEPVKPLKEAVEEFKKGYVERLLHLTRGNMSRAAELAGKYRADFYNLVKKHKLAPKDFRDPEEDG